MTDPLAGILGGGGADPLASVLGGSSASTQPQQSYDISPDDNEYVKRVKGLLNRQDIRPEQRQKLEGLLQQFQAIPKAEGAVQQFAETGAQAAISPIAGVANTLGKIPVVGAPFKAIGNVTNQAIQKLEPNEESANPWAQYLGTVAGGVAGNIPVFKGAAIVTDLLGNAATRLAPGVATKALAAIGRVGDAVEQVSPLAAHVVDAAPKQLATGIIGQGAIDPESLTTPKGIAMAGAFSLFGALQEGVGKYNKVLDNARKASDINTQIGVMDMLERQADTIRETRDRTLKVFEKRSSKPGSVDLDGSLEASAMADRYRAAASQFRDAGRESDAKQLEEFAAKLDERATKLSQPESTVEAETPQLPTVLEVAEKNLDRRATELAQTFTQRAEEAARGKASRVPGMQSDIPTGDLTTIQDPSQRIKLIADEQNNQLFDSEQQKAEFQQRVANVLDIDPSGKTTPDMAAKLVAKAMGLKKSPRLVDVETVPRQLYTPEGLIEKPEGVGRWTPPLTIDEINDAYRKANDEATRVLSNAQLEGIRTPHFEGQDGGIPLRTIEEITHEMGLLSEAIEGRAQVRRTAEGRIVPMEALVDAYGNPLKPIPQPKDPLKLSSSGSSGTAANPVDILTSPSRAPRTSVPGIDRTTAPTVETDTPTGQAQRNILGRVVLPETHESFLAAMQTGSFWGKLYQRGVDATAPLRYLKTDLQRDNPHALARLARSYGSTAEAMINHGTLKLDEDGSIVPDGGKGLRAVLQPVKSRLDEFVSYLIAKRAQEVGHDKVGINEHDANLVVANADPIIRAAAQEFTDWSRRVTALAEQSGMLEPGTLALFKDISNNYVYLKRLFEEPGKVEGAFKSGDFSPKQLYYKFKGSFRDIVNPIAAEIARTERVAKAIYMNNAVRSFADWMNANPEVAQKLGVKQIVDASETTSPELLREAKNLMENMRQDGKSINLSEAKQMALLLGNKATHAEGNTIAYYDKGRIVRYQVPAEIAQAYTSLNPAELRFWEQWMGLPARALKAGVTLNPVFQFYNLIRDSYDAALNSKYGFTFGVDSAIGLLEAVKRGDAWQEWRSAGGGFHTLSTAGGKKLAHVYRDVTDTHKFIERIRHPIEGLKTLAAPIEEAARLGEYMRARGKGASVTEAVMAANSVTTDFKQIGASMQGLSAMTAFMNPAIQSLDNMAKSIGRNPKQVAMWGFGAITLPTIALWMANKDDQEINDLRKTESGLAYWFIRGPKGNILKLPKPFLYGQMFGTTMESALDELYHRDPQSVNRAAKGILSQATISMVPTVLQAGLSLYGNKDWFTGAPIVPLDREEVEPRHQTQFATGEAAQRLGAVLNVSPAKIEFLTRQFLGTSGMDVAKAADLVIRRTDPNAPASPILADMPFLGRLFARTPSLGVEPVRTFYDQAGKYKTIVNTMKYLAENKPQDLQRYVQEHGQDIGLATVYAQTRSEINKIRNAIDDITTAPVSVINPQEKRKTIDYLLRQVIEITRQVNAAVAVAKATPQENTSGLVASAQP